MMFVVRENRWKSFCFYMFFIGLIVYGPIVGIARSQTQVQNPLETKNVLILNGAEPNTPAFESLNQELLAVLQSGGIGIRNQFFEYLGLTRNPSPESRKLRMQLVSRRYSEHKMDLIITLYPNSLKFLLDMDQSFFPAAPVMALIIPQGYKLPETDRRIIPHVVVPDLNRTLEIGLKLVPKAERIYVVNGVDPMDRWVERLARKDFKKWEDRLDFYHLSDLPLEKILATVSAAPANSIVYLTTFSKDVTGKYMRTVEVSEELAEVSKAPVFGFLGTVIGHGNVGGSLISFKHIGTKAGELALDILRGAQNTENIPEVLNVPQVDIFDWRQLKHWNLSESDLPRGSVIVNREFSPWNLRYYIIGVLVFIMAQLLLIIGLLAQKRRTRLAEEALRQHRKELAYVTRIATMGELTTSLAHEINQPLTAIRSNAGAALRFLSQPEPDIREVRQILEDIVRDDRRASNVIQNIRAMVKKEKRNKELLDLNKVIRGVVDLIRDDSLLKGLSIALELNRGLKMIHGDPIQLQQVILNLILNSAVAMRNTPRDQRKIIVRTAMADDRIVNVSVTDFGTGIDENNIERLFEAFYTTKSEGLGMGLSISKTIVHAHGGDIKASNNREGGATFVITLPANQGDAS